MTVLDNHGVSYESQRAMCEARHMSISAYATRKYRGWKLSKNLSTPVNPIYQGIKIVDPLGNEYESISEMCKAHGIKRGTYYDRVSKGKNMAEALGLVA